MPKDQISLLKWSLEDVRNVTISGVDHLTKEQLFNEAIKGEYPLGSYLMHIGEAELFWTEMLSGQEQPEELKKRVYYDVWFDPFKAPDGPKEPLEPGVYFDALKDVRKILFDHLDNMDDSELEDVIKVSWGSCSKKWIVYHLIEHEAHHRGQIFQMIRQAGWNKPEKKK